MVKERSGERYQSSAWFTTLEASAIGLVCLVVYLPSLRNGFIWDDYAWIVKSPIIHAPDALRRYWFTFQSPDYFPFIHTLFWIEWKLWGANAAAWHFATIFLHALTSITIWWTMRSLKLPAAWLSALIFAIHPVNVEAVAWIYQQRTILPMFLSLSSLMAYLRSHEAGNSRLDTQRISVLWYSFSLLMFTLAMLSKVSVAGFPVLLLGLHWWRQGRVARQDLLKTVPFFVVAVSLGLLTAYVQIHRNIGSDVVRTDSFPARLAGSGWAVWFYLYKFLFPVNLMFVYPRWDINPLSIVSYVPLLALICCFAAAWKFRRTWGRWTIAGLGWFIVMLVPVLGFVNIYFMRYSLVADHWQYVAVIGPIALAVGAAVRLAQASRQRYAGLVAAGIVVCLFGVITWRQQAMYRNEETLWRETIARNPNAWMAHNNLGLVLAESGRLDDAIAEYEAALEIKPDCPEAHVSLAATLIDCGQFDEAYVHLTKALKLRPNSVSAHYNMGRLFAERNRIEQAVEEYRRALRLNPYLAKAYTNLGVILLQQGKTEEAVACHRKAIALDTQLPEAYNNLGVALASLGKMEEAAKEFARALRIKPDYGAAQRNLARARNALGYNSRSGEKTE